MKSPPLKLALSLHDKLNSPAFEYDQVLFNDSIIQIDLSHMD